MNLKALTIYFSGLSVALVVLFGFITWHGSDVEFQYYTAIRMHACDIVKNDRSTLREFHPDKCKVRRRSIWPGEVIDVSCTATDDDGREHQFSYSYSDVHLIFNYFFKHYLRLTRGGYCNG
ncbi:hypothetical protein [Herbaspirillum sp. YR522]|uniref:hypothetical protein n=1 Tax=Herbaspirillum sp. YR522 TaxID=1144342 RepID=UPI00026FC48C|nr:hypothetical protein [Herbaspirillum sp. YR522]EJN08609.1 hypothetical protein PMI40_01170 [Herbaspirillum sp. YR522]